MPPAVQQQQLADASSNPPHNARDAALKGASLAFGKPKVAPKPQVNTYSGNNGALAAARQSSTPQPQLLRPQGTGNSSTSQLSQTSHLGLPQAQPGRARSPSVIAASLAAQRHTPASDSTDTRRRSMMDSSNNTSNDSLPGAGTVKDIRARFNASVSAATSPAAAKAAPALTGPSLSQTSEPTDATSIPPTTSLVKMFEQNKAAHAAAPAAVRSPKPAPILTSRGGPPPLKSPKPTRNITVPFASPERSKSDAPKPRPVSAGNIAAKPKPAPKPAKFLGDAQKTSPHVSPKVPPKPTFVTSAREVPAPSKEDSDDDDAAYMSAPETQTDHRAKPILPPPRRSNKKITKEDTPSRTGASASTRPAQVAHLRRHSATSGTSSAPPLETRTLLPPPPISSSYKRTSMKQIEPHITGESLANAMVGAALAGSRVSTPASQSKSPLPPPPRRSGNQHHHHHPHLFHSHNHSRETSPTKKPGKLMPTLRKEPSSSDSESGRDAKHKKKRALGPKHPNKHAEGTRKRWRDSINEREKKRYEGVWAANRGLYLHPSQLHPAVLASVPNPEELKDEVVNFVVRDIWNRSRLPPHVLEEVWELVDGRGVGRLRREEFVVGMWLIDQVLKGKKLPIKVQESVWASVRGAGVKVRIRG